jgi:Hypothetical protein (DUF2513)
VKRNLDTIRKLLDLAEAQPAGKNLMTFSGDFENTPVEVVEHIRLMIEAGLISGEAHPDPNMPGGGIFVISNVTWSGHDFLNAARSDTVWNATKGRIAKAGAWTFGLVLEILKEEAKRQIGVT